MKRVAVSQRVELWPERGERRDALDQRLAIFLTAAGVAPLSVPNGLAGVGDLSVWLRACAPAGLVLSGGEDRGVHAERDETEDKLLAYAEAGALPVLGLCRGMQVMALRAGAALQPVEGHGRTRHILQGALQGEVNSFHALAVAACPDAYTVLARSSDSSVEAIRAKAKPWEGWMWHPEREAKFAVRDVDRVRQLFGTVP